MNRLVDHIEKSIQTHRLLRDDESILLAVSGGLDSMVLLHVLHEIAGKHDWRLVIAHFNHQLRGRSSTADEMLVRKTAISLKLPCVVEGADVRRFGVEQGLSIEMSARQLRHRFLVRISRRRRIRTVALAHHADDQVELFFLRLLRGSGGEGLAGMKCANPSPIDQGIKLVRPLFDLDKSELAEFARERRIKFREDASNRSLDFQRNRIRHELLPLLRQHYQPALGRTTLRLMDIVGEETEFVMQTARQWLKSKSRTDFSRLAVAVQRLVLQIQMLALGVVADYELIEKLRGSFNKPVSLNSRTGVARDAQGKVYLKRHRAVGFETGQTALDLTQNKSPVIFDGLKIQWQFMRARGPAPRKPGGQSEYFDATKVGNWVTLRHWRPGDRFQPIGTSSPRKLQDLFTNEKIPREERSGLCVAVTAGGELFWVEKLRISELFKLDKHTVERLKWVWWRV